MKCVLALERQWEWSDGCRRLRHNAGVGPALTGLRVCPVCCEDVSRLQCVDSVSGVDSSLKRVAVVEDFFDIIYAMHVEISSDPGKSPKHAGQKKTYKAIAETYAFLPREAVTHFLMSCGECQKRMHISTTGQDYKENDRPSSLVSEVIDYNMPLTTTYMKQMRLQCMSYNKNESD
ncbi:hypothetical protein F2P81_011335 [Scophthalmus maximus]|uniref:Nucleolar protein 4-like n=1 Tax=Scophthalmus maximus TaxID=52904 RepID=A0A6A4SPV4_SCOMX|nr:hypothetical protein F2P81_011335 [Scophthalmus maximus]